MDSLNSSKDKDNNLDESAGYFPMEKKLTKCVNEEDVLLLKLNN